MATTKILMADNDPDFLETRREFLEKEGYEIIVASSPSDAQMKLQQDDIALVIVDIRLLNDDDEKDISGLEFARSIEHPLPILILTGYPAFEYARQALRFQASGNLVAHDFIAKEEGSTAFLTAVRGALAIAEKRKEVLVPDVSVTEKTPTRPSVIKHWKSRLASLTLLLSLGAGIIATIYGDPRWLIGTVALAILAVFLIGALE